MTLSTLRDPSPDTTHYRNSVFNEGANLAVQVIRLVKEHKEEVARAQTGVLSVETAADPLQQLSYEFRIHRTLGLLDNYAGKLQHFGDEPIYDTDLAFKRYANMIPKAQKMIADLKEMKKSLTENDCTISLLSESLRLVGRLFLFPTSIQDHSCIIAKAIAAAVEEKCTEVLEKFKSANEATLGNDWKKSLIAIYKTVGACPKESQRLAVP